MSNLLNRLHKSLGSGVKPDSTTIATLFHEYQEQRKPRMKVAFEQSYFLTRLQTCDGFLNWLTMMYLVPVLGLGVLAIQLAEFCAGSPKFDFIELEKKPDRYTALRWQDEICVSPRAENTAGERLAALKKRWLIKGVAILMKCIKIEESARFQLSGLETWWKSYWVLTLGFILLSGWWLRFFL